MMRKLLALGTLCALTLMTSQVGADVIATRTRTLDFIVGAGTASCAPATLIPLNNAGSTAMSFFTWKDNQRVVISFNAECSVKAVNFSTWLGIQILVDGSAAPPSSPTNDNAFCTSHGNNQLDGWVSAVTTVVSVVPEPGIHTVKVQGTLIGCSDTDDDAWRIDDTSTVVMN